MEELKDELEKMIEETNNMFVLEQIKALLKNLQK